MSVPGDYKYSKDHEWAAILGESATVGITEFAQSELGELVFVDLPAVGKKISKGQSICVVESTKAASDVYAPVSGEIITVNDSLRDDPGLINREPYTGGWMVKIKIDGSVADLMDAKTYTEFLEKRK